MKSEIKNAFKPASRNVCRVYECKLCGKKYFNRNEARYCVSSNHRKTWKMSNRMSISGKGRNGLMSFVRVELNE